MCTHLDCPFYCATTDTCDYILLTGKARGVKSEQCTKYRTGFSGDDKPLNSRLTPGSMSAKIIKRLEKSYYYGIEVKMLANKAGCSEVWARTWMYRVHPENAKRIKPWEEP